LREPERDVVKLAQFCKILRLSSGAQKVVFANINDFLKGKINENEKIKNNGGSELTGLAWPVGALPFWLHRQFRAKLAAGSDDAQFRRDLHAV